MISIFFPGRAGREKPGGRAGRGKPARQLPGRADCIFFMIYYVILHYSIRWYIIVHYIGGLSTLVSLGGKSPAPSRLAAVEGLDGRTANLLTEPGQKVTHQKSST